MKVKYINPTAFPSTLKIESQVADYYMGNDSAHDLAHARHVCGWALGIGNSLGLLNAHVREIILASYCHDMFASNRVHHHKLAHDFVETGGLHNLGWGLTPVQTKRIAMACLEHRSACPKTDLYSPVSEIISAADFGKPNNKLRYLRSYNYAKDKLGLNKDDAIVHAHNHIAEKFGNPDLSQLRPMYRSLFELEYLESADEIFQQTLDETKQLIEGLL